jgi:hypothetical protein
MYSNEIYVNVVCFFSHKISYCTILTLLLKDVRWHKVYVMKSNEVNSVSIGLLLTLFLEHECYDTGTAGLMTEWLGE